MILFLRIYEFIFRIVNVLIINMLFIIRINCMGNFIVFIVCEMFVGYFFGM